MPSAKPAATGSPPHARAASHTVGTQTLRRTSGRAPSPAEYFNPRLVHLLRHTLPSPVRQTARALSEKRPGRPSSAAATAPPVTRHSRPHRQQSAQEPPQAEPTRPARPTGPERAGAAALAGPGFAHPAALTSLSGGTGPRDARPAHHPPAPHRAGRPAPLDCGKPPAHRKSATVRDHRPSQQSRPRR